MADQNQHGGIHVGWSAIPFLCYALVFPPLIQGGNTMKFKKTPLKERGTYTYRFADGTVSKITADKDGATTVDIKSLHALDDSEVYYNIKNGRPQLSDKEKLAIKDWQDEHLGEEVPKNWNLSINSLMQADGDSADKSRVMLEMATALCVDEPSSEISLLRDFINTLPDSQQELYRLKYIEEYSQTEIAEMLGVSNMAITNRVKRLEETIKNNFLDFCNMGV